MTDDMMTPPVGDGFDPMERYRKELALRQTFSTLGLALFVMMTVWLGLTIVLSVIVQVLSFRTPAILDFYNDYALIFNELGLAIGVVASLPIVGKVPQVTVESRSFSAGHFVRLFSIAFAISTVGNWISNLFLSVWNGATGNEVTNEVIDLVMETNPWLSFIAVGLCAPFLEEYFFRKLLIDRLRPYGELAAIMTSALLFALFHGNFSQLFYAFGAGVLLSYLYLRSGSFFLTFLFHALFNTLSGVLPMLVMDDILAFEQAIAGLTDEALTEMMPDLMQNYGASLLFYAFYVLFLGLMTILGFIYFFKGLRRTHVTRGEHGLSAGRVWRIAIFNTGMLLALILLLLLMLFSLFTL